MTEEERKADIVEARGRLGIPDPVNPWEPLGKGHFSQGKGGGDVPDHPLLGWGVPDRYPPPSPWGRGRPDPPPPLVPFPAVPGQPPERFPGTYPPPTLYERPN